MKYVILDSDYGPDVDDLVAHAVLHHFADEGECTILAGISCISNDRSPGAMNAVNTWHGRPNIPVGGWSGTIGHTASSDLFPDGGAGGESDGDAWAVSIYDADATYPRTITNTNYDDAVELYRQTLHDAEDGSVTIITIGMLNAVSDLLDSSADGIDNRTGSDLINAKVDSMYVMGGRDSGAEFNMRHAREEASNVADNFPRPIYWSQFEIGSSIYTGRWSDPLEPGEPEPEHIVRFGMEEFNFIPGSDGNGRQSWDAMNVLAAIREESGGFSFVRGTMSIDSEDGSSSWVDSESGPHYRASKTETDAWYEELLEPMVFTAQSEATEFGAWSDTATSSDTADIWGDWSEWTLSDESTGSIVRLLADTVGVTDSLDLIVNLGIVTQDIVTGNPEISQPSIGQTHVLTAQNIVTGAPVISQPTLDSGVVHELVAQDIVTGPPLISQPTLSQTHQLTAQDIATGDPEISQPSIGQTHVLTAQDIVTGAPEISQPSLVSVLPDELIAQDIVTGPPEISQPTLGQTHILTAQSIEAGAPQISQPTLSQTHVLTAQGILTGAPEISQPLLNVELYEVQRVVLSASIARRTELAASITRRVTVEARLR